MKNLLILFLILSNATSFAQIKITEKVVKPNIHSINYFNEFKLDSLDRKLVLNFDYFNFDNNDKKYNGISIINNPFSQQYFSGTNSNNQNNQNFSGKVDFEYPMKWINLSFGGKITNSKSKNTITSFNSGLVS